MLLPIHWKNICMKRSPEPFKHNSFCQKAAKASSFVFIQLYDSIFRGFNASTETNISLPLENKNRHLCISCF